MSMRQCCQNSFTGEESRDEHLPFTGMHVILMGDFHQFPPVANPHFALYSKSPTTIPDALHGRWVFRQFETVVYNVKFDSRTLSGQIF